MVEVSITALTQKGSRIPNEESVHEKWKFREVFNSYYSSDAVDDA